MSNFDKNKVTKALKRCLKDGLCFLVIASTLWAINTFVILNADVPTGSMIPTLPEGCHFVADRRAYVNMSPERYDVIVFHAPDTGELYVKRVIGLPGETVHIRGGKVYINNETEALDDSFCKEPMKYEDKDYKVPADSYFMLGDNRNDSLDSRYWTNTYVSSDLILGKVWFMYYPEFKVFS